MIRRKKIWLGLFLILSMMLTACGEQSAKKPTIRLGTGGVGGNYYSYGRNLSDVVSESTVYHVEVRETAGSAANVRLVSQGFVDMAIVQSDTLQDAIAGKGKFEEGALTGIHSVASLYTESCQLVTLEQADIEEVEDLKGKKVSIGAKDSGVVANAKLIMKMSGLAEKDVDLVYMSFAESAKALEEGAIDAFFCTASVPTTAVVELAQHMADKGSCIKLISMSSTAINQICNESEAFVRKAIPAGTYAGQDEDVFTIGVNAILIANDDFDEHIENEMLELLTAHNEEIQKVSFGVPVNTKDSDKKLSLSLDMYMTLTLAVLVLYLGSFLRKKIKVLETFCIPAPVIGGLIFAVLSCVLYVTGIAEFSFDETLKTICMIMFFTSVGFQANLKVLKSGGMSLLVFLGCVIVLIIGQNALAVGLSHLLHVNPFIGMCTGSIPMVGGHGTAGAFGLVLEDLGLEGATTLCTAAATFGLIVGSLLGGPIGRRLILKNDLLKTVVEADDSVLVEDEVKHRRSVSMYAPAAYQMAIAMGIGTIVSLVLSKTGMTFPVYIGAMIVAAFMRNIGEYSGKFTVHMGEINDIGGICLSFFLGIAMVTLKLWQLADLALPLMILLFAQAVLMAIFAYFVVYNVMGRNYDAAILSAGTCGFGMGATPNAMANMQALTEKFAPSVKAYLLVPIVGSMFADFINSIVITFFINIL